MYHPEEEEYKIYYAQALYQACLYEEAMKVTVQIENPEMNGKVNCYSKFISFLLSINDNEINNSKYNKKIEECIWSYQVLFCIYTICKSR